MNRSRHIVVPAKLYTLSTEECPLYFPVDDTTNLRPSFDMELTVCKLSISLRRDVISVFPEAATFLKQHTDKNLYVIVSYQHSKTDLVAWTDEAAFEKDRLLENYMGFCHRFMILLKQKVFQDEDNADNFFGDYTDPCSGLPILTRSSSAVFAEVDAIQALLRYPLDQVGSCTIVKHPLWGSSSYPASMVVSATPEQIKDVLHSMASKILCHFDQHLEKSQTQSQTLTQSHSQFESQSQSQIQSQSTTKEAHAIQDINGASTTFHLTSSPSNVCTNIHIISGDINIDDAYTDTDRATDTDNIDANIDPDVNLDVNIDKVDTQILLEEFDNLHLNKSQTMQSGSIRPQSQSKSQSKSQSQSESQSQSQSPILTQTSPITAD